MTLLLDYNEDRSIFAQKKINSFSRMVANRIQSKLNTLEMDLAIGTKMRKARIHIDTLSSYRGFGSGTYKMSVVKKMISTDDFLNMPLEDRKCEVIPYEKCRNQKLLEECNCDPLALIHNQVGY